MSHSMPLRQIFPKPRLSEAIPEMQAPTKPGQMLNIGPSTKELEITAYPFDIPNTIEPLIPPWLASFGQDSAAPCLWCFGTSARTNVQAIPALEDEMGDI